VLRDNAVVAAAAKGKLLLLLLLLLAQALQTRLWLPVLRDKMLFWLLRLMVHCCCWCC
jgi:hypothetical protein